MIWFILLAILGFVIGSIPNGIIIGKYVKGVDLREVGSGNIGTANAIRALGPFWGIMVFVTDVLKGTIPVVMGYMLNKYVPGAIPAHLAPYAPLAAGLMAVLGHNNSLFLGFKGGKGIATSFGVFVVLHWQSAVLALLVWIATVAITRIASLGSLLGALAAPTIMIFFKVPAFIIIYGFIVAGIAFYKHRENIGRLLRGEERKITDKAGRKTVTTEDGSEKVSGDSE